MNADWKIAGAAWYRELPELTINEVISGGFSLITISHVDGEFVLEAPITENQAFQNVTEAMIAGDEIFEEISNSATARIARSAGLDSSEWVYAEDRPIVFSNTLAENVMIRLNEDSWWNLEKDGSIEGVYPTADDAAQAHRQGMSPRQ